MVAPEDAPPMHVVTNGWNLGGRLPTRSTATLTLTNIKALTLDVTAAALPNGQAKVQSDGPLVLTLSHLRPGTVVSTGRTRLFADAGGRAVVHLPSGTSAVTWAHH